MIYIRFYDHLNTHGDSTPIEKIGCPLPIRVEGVGFLLSETDLCIRVAFMLEDYSESTDLEREYRCREDMVILKSTIIEMKKLKVEESTSIPKADAIKKILEIVKNFESEYDLVEVEKVVEEAKKYGLETTPTIRIIEEMLRKTGELYEPKHGYVKTVRPRVF